MVIKGGSRGSGGQLAGHLLRADTNERVEVVELTGVAATTLPAALREMSAVATGTRCSKPLYHASLNTGPGERLTPAQQRHAIAALERRLGLVGHARAVVEHRKAGRDHLHVVWSRIDTATMRAVHDGFNYRAHEEVARQLEREFDHRPVQGAHVGRNDRPGPTRTPATAELQQAARTKTDPAAITAEVTRLWQAADSGKAFAAALHDAGYILAQGDKRGFCLIDPAGGVHSLVRRIEGVRTKEVTARLAEIDLTSLPTADQAREQLRQRQAGASPGQSNDLAPPGAPPQLVEGGARSSILKTPVTPPQRAGTDAVGMAEGGDAAAAQRPALHARQNRPDRRADHRRSDQATGQRPAGRGGSSSETLYSVGIRLGAALARPAGAMLRGLGLSGGGGTRPPLRAAVTGMLSLFTDPRPLFVPGGGGAAPRVTQVKGLPPERLNLRRPDGPSTESIGKIQEQIEKLTAYGLSTGESTADQVQELKNVLHALLEQAGLRAILGPYYRPEHRNREPGR